MPLAGVYNAEWWWGERQKGEAERYLRSKDRNGMIAIPRCNNRTGDSVQDDDVGDV